MVGTHLSVVEEHMGSAAWELLAQAPREDAEPAADGCALTMDTLLLQATCYTEAGKPARAARLFGQVLASGTLSRVRGDPLRYRLDHERLPRLALWVQILRIVVDGEAVLAALDLHQLMFGLEERQRLAG
jgi:hypothetical protein